jgi:hypothetical protein
MIYIAKQVKACLFTGENPKELESFIADHCARHHDSPTLLNWAPSINPVFSTYRFATDNQPHHQLVRCNEYLVAHYCGTLEVMTKKRFELLYDDLKQEALL